MKLQSLDIENIRTYGAASVTFSSGVTLFEGDVGCGKSSLLYAIEFALFGLGDLKASHLLRHGAENGSVKLSFEVTGKHVTVFRKLERKKDTARQAPGWIEEDGVRTEYSPEELKTKILSILGFRENPSAKATSWIFRYAVFTPQEQMKEILLLRPEERLQTLRKAFGVEEYKTAQEHANVVQQHLREKGREIKGQVADVPELQAKKAVLESQLQTLDLQKQTIFTQVAAAQDQVVASDTSVQAARAVSLALEREAAEVPLLQKRVEELDRQHARLEFDSKTLDAKNAQWDQDEKTLQQQVKTGITNDPQGQWETAESNVRQLQQQLGAAEHTAREHQHLRSGSCPTCGQKIPDGLNGKIQAAESAFKEAQTKFQTARDSEAALRAQVRQFNDQKMLQQKIQQVQALRAQSEVQRTDMTAKMVETAQQLESAKNAWQEKKHHLEKVQDARVQLQKAEMQLREKQTALQTALKTQAATEAQEKHVRQNLADIEASLERKAQLALKLKNLEEKTAWIADPFLPALTTIEEHVLRRINDEFNRLFSRWFSQLLETQDLEAEVDASFTPQIHQQGFEQDFAALSGGEKSALALAYRLALNTIVRQTTPSLKDNLLILDEPTDGFSKEQLGRMRSVLQEAGAQQVLLVSHERELEAFCDQVFLVEKHYGESAVKEL
ncbi:AAA family ATPase [Candidatus Micrarchaeota archaeon]|nr:AAA family ATPase [Candidatus Micrarchaeota archaeon]